MAGNRKKAEALVYEYIEMLLPGSENVEIYKQLFAGMSDKQFDEFIQKLEDGSATLAIVDPNFGKEGAPSLSTERNLAIAKKLGHNFFERIWMRDDADSPAYLSNVEYLIGDLPLRRQAQLLVKKISIPEDNNSVDDLTGQPTGKSKGSKISYPETQMLSARGLTDTLTELLKYRGGDVKGFAAMNAQISRTGGVSQATIEPLGTTVKSTETMSSFLKSMHLDNTL
jgi:hypothetical protein